MKAQDKAMWSVLNGHSPTSCAKLMFVIALCMIDKVTSIGQVSHGIDPGIRASNCSPTMIDRLKEDVLKHNPSVIHADVDWKEDKQVSPGSRI